MLLRCNNVAASHECIATLASSCIILPYLPGDDVRMGRTRWHHDQIPLWTMLPSSIIMLDDAAAAAAADSIIPRLTLVSSASAAHLIVVDEFLIDPKPANYLHLSQGVKMKGYLILSREFRLLQGSCSSESNRNHVSGFMIIRN